MPRVVTTFADEASNVTKASILHAWSDLLKITDNWTLRGSTEGEEAECSTKLSTVSYGYPFSPTSLTFSANRLQDAAAVWQQIAGRVRAGTLVSISATKPVRPRMPFLNLHDTDIVNFCTQRGAFFDVLKYYSAILKVFDTARSVRLEVARDHEIEDSEKLRFRVQVTGEIERILDQEDAFVDFVQSIFSLETLSYFVVTPEIVDAGQGLSGGSR